MEQRELCESEELKGALNKTKNETPGDGLTK